MKIKDCRTEYMDDLELAAVNIIRRFWKAGKYPPISYIKLIKFWSPEFEDDIIKYCSHCGSNITNKERVFKLEITEVKD